MELNPVDVGRRILSPYGEIKYLYVDCNTAYSKTEILEKVKLGTGYHLIYWVSDFNKASRFMESLVSPKIRCFSCPGQ
jgi:hypothetical protein